MKKLLIYTFIFVTAFFLHAETQNKASTSEKQNTIQGVVVEGNGTPAMFVSVVIMKDGKIITGILTDTIGKFVLKGNFEGRFQLKISALGHEDMIKDIVLTKNTMLDVGHITIKEQPMLLEGVVVTESVAEKTVTIEKTTINPSSSMYSTTNSLLDVLKTSPSIMIDDNGQVALRGNSNILILIDGVPTALDELSSIPTANIQSIDVVTSPDVKYDSEGTGGIINIVSKKQIPDAFTMMLSANYGFLSFVNGNFAMSYNKNKWGFRLNYNGKYEKDNIKSDLVRQIFYNDETINQLINATKKNGMHNIGMNIQYKITPQNMLSLNVKAGFPRMNNFRTFNNHYITITGIQSDKMRQTDITFNREMIETSISYKHSFNNEKRQLGTSASMSLINGHRPSYYYENKQMTQYSNSGGHPRIATYSLDFMTMLEKGKLEVGLKMTYRQNNIDHKMYEWDKNKNDWQYSITLSNDLQHREYIPAAYVMYSVKQNKFSHKAGVRFEYSYVTLKNKKDQLHEHSDHYFLSPNIEINYHFNDAWQLSFNLSRRISRPTYPQLNPYINLIDNYNYETGNIRLKPEKANKLELSYNYTAQTLKLNGNAYFNYIQDYINQIAYIEQNILVMTFVNGKHLLNTGLEHNLKWTPLKWFGLDWGINAFFTKSQSEYQQTVFNNRGWTCNTNASLNFKPVKGMTIQMQYFVTTPQYFPQFTTRTIHYGNIGLRQQLCKNSLSLSLLLTDVFNTKRWDINSDNPLYTLINNNKNQTRVVWLGITWNFHSYKSIQQQAKQEEDRTIIKIGE